MPASQKTASPSTAIRLVHGALVTGLLLFALVSHFVLRPTIENSGGLPATWITGLLAVSVGICVLSLFLRRRVRRRSPDQSSDAFWMTASPLALQMWAPLEAAGLLAVVLYARTGSLAAIAIAAVPVLLLIGLNPAYLEKR